MANPKVEKQVVDPKVALLAKLSKIMEATGYLQKDKKNKFDGYMYLSEQKIKEHFSDLLVEHKVMFLPKETRVVRSEATTTNTGKPSRLTEVESFYAFVDVETGYEINGMISGQGEDRSDKGIYKAMTGALKYVFINTFLVPAGDDPENDDDQKPEKPVQKPVEKPVPPAPREVAPESRNNKAPVINRTKFTGRQKQLADAMDLFTTNQELGDYYLSLDKKDQTLIFNYKEYLKGKLEGTWVKK